LRIEHQGMIPRAWKTKKPPNGGFFAVGAN